MYQSKFGFHPCDKATFLKLKKLHKYYWMTVQKFHEWQRWERKQPQNRVLREYFRDENNRKCGFKVIGPKPEPKYCPHFITVKSWVGKVMDERVLYDYQNARHPVDKDQVKPLNLTHAQIDSLLSQVETWFSP